MRSRRSRVILSAFDHPIGDGESGGDQREANAQKMTAFAQQQLEGARLEHDLNANAEKRDYAQDDQGHAGLGGGGLQLGAVVLAFAQHRRQVANRLGKVAAGAGLR